MSKLAQLPEIDLEILKLLWLESVNPKVGRKVDGGLTRKEIFAELVAKFPSIKKAVSLKRYLRRLITQNDDQAPYLVGKEIEGKGMPFVYKINAQTIVTWPSTAFMLCQLWKARHLQVQDLVDAMSIQHSVPFVTSTKASETDIKKQAEKQLEWCRNRGYVTYVEKHKAEISPSPRLEYEYRFLRFLASQPDPGRSATVFPVSSSADKPID